MGKLQFNPNDALNCMYAYWYMTKHGEDAIEASDQAIDITIEKEYFKTISLIDEHASHRKGYTAIASRSRKQHKSLLRQPARNNFA